jgi:hypothetical protein
MATPTPLLSRWGGICADGGFDTSLAVAGSRLLCRSLGFQGSLPIYLLLKFFFFTRSANFSQVILIKPLIVSIVPPDKVDTVGPGPFSLRASWLDYGTKGADDGFPDNTHAIYGIHMLVWIKLLRGYNAQKG